MALEVGDGCEGPDEQPAWRENRFDPGKERSVEIVEQKDQVPRPARHLRGREVSELRSERHVEFGCASCGKAESNIGDIDNGHVPSECGHPESIAPGPAGYVERYGWLWEKIKIRCEPGRRLRRPRLVPESLVPVCAVVSRHGSHRRCRCVPCSYKGLSHEGRDIQEPTRGFARKARQITPAEEAFKNGAS